MGKPKGTSRNGQAVLSQLVIPSIPGEYQAIQFLQVTLSKIRQLLGQQRFCDQWTSNVVELMATGSRPR